MFKKLPKRLYYHAPTMVRTIVILVVILYLIWLEVRFQVFLP
ncbi:hypothetical protein [Salinimicrobium oceani]|nr:hypothetical protein [Salinimicrobium oceani]